MRKDFLWGASESGFQFEMGDTKGLAIDRNTDWFVWVHDKKNIENKLVSGDLPEHGINYWYLYKQDHQLAKELGMNAYRLGIEWSRIFPEPTFKVEVDVERDDNNIITDVNIDKAALEQLLIYANQNALGHYRQIIKDLRDRGFKVFVCLNHFTLPLWIHDPIKARDSELKEGPLGWVDSNTVIEFAKYAAFIAWYFGDLVDMWALFNEPTVVAELGYVLIDNGFPPSVFDPVGYINAILNFANAHARGYDAIKKWDTKIADRDSPSAAEIGLIHSVTMTYPLDPKNKKDVEAAKHASYLTNEWILNAITKGEVDLDFDGEIVDYEKIQSFRNKLDWIGVNYYTRTVIKHSEKLMLEASELTDFEMVPGYGHLCERNGRSNAGNKTTDFGWEVYPQGLRDIINLLWNKYKMPIYVTENGIADKKDVLRPHFLIDHIDMVQKAAEEDKVDVRGYFVWSLTDNYEWAHGFKMRFGLIEVNLNTKERIKRGSAEIFRTIAENNGVPENLKRK